MSLVLLLTPISILKKIIAYKRYCETKRDSISLLRTHNAKTFATHFLIPTDEYLYLCGYLTNTSVLLSSQLYHLTFPGRFFCRF